MGSVPSGDSCTTTVREEGVERRRDGVGAPGRTGEVCICVSVCVCVYVCVGEEGRRKGVCKYYCIQLFVHVSGSQILMRFIAHHLTSTPSRCIQL